MFGSVTLVNLLIAALCGGSLAFNLFRLTTLDFANWTFGFSSCQTRTITVFRTLIHRDVNPHHIMYLMSTTVKFAWTRFREWRTVSIAANRLSPILEPSARTKLNRFAIILLIKSIINSQIPRESILRTRYSRPPRDSNQLDQWRIG
jgi:hypothetical protein